MSMEQVEALAETIVPAAEAEQPQWVEPNWVRLQPGDIIDALTELKVNEKGDFEYHSISECAEGRNFAIWKRDDDHPEGGIWYEIEWRTDLKAYAYDTNCPLG